MRKEAENSWKQAKDDFEKADILFSSKKYDGAVFFYQQSVEKGLKAISLEKNKELPKTHDITFLAKLVKAPQEVLTSCSALNPVYVNSRYTDFALKIPAEYYDTKKAQGYKNLAEDLLRWIKKTLES